MTTQQDSVDVERAIAAFDAAHWTDCFRQAAVLRELLAVQHGLPRRFDDEESIAIHDALSLPLPITQRDEQAKTYADGVEDAAKVAERSAAYFRDFAVTNGASDEGAEAARIACDDLATAIRRLSIEQGANQ